MSAGLQSLGRLWGRIHSPTRLASGGWWHSLAGGHMAPIFKVSIFKSLLGLHIASSSACHTISLCLPLIRVHAIAFRADPRHPGPSLHLQSPCSSRKVIVRFQGLGNRSFWGGCYSAYPNWPPTVPPLPLCTRSTHQKVASISQPLELYDLLDQQNMGRVTRGLAASAVPQLEPGHHAIKKRV